MKYQIRSGLAYCLVDARPVFLDVRRDRYFMIQGALETAFKSFIAADALSPETIGCLTRAGILEPAAGPVEIPLPPAIIPAERSVVESMLARRRPRPRRIDTIQAISCLARSRLRLRRAGFAQNLARLHARKGTATGQQPMGQLSIELRAAHFHAARCLFPAKQNCLPGSLALLDFLPDSGVAADLIIGVRMEPYGAHCWVQSKETLLNETLDYAASFTPILVV